MRELDGRAHDGDARRLRRQAADERTVDLAGMDRQPVEVRERGRAGAEVVDREPYADVAQPLEAGEDLLRLAHHATLGDFEVEYSRRDVGLLDGRAHAIGERGLGQI